MKTIAVTGGTGFVGKFLIKALSDKGYNIRIITRRKPKTLLPDIEYAEVDYTNTDTLKYAFDKADAVIHLAAALFCTSKKDFLKANGVGTSHVVEAAKAAGVKKIVYLSSLAAGGPAEGKPRDEEQPDEPVSNYGISKLEGEKAVRTFPDGAFVILRPAIIYGGRDAGVSTISDWVRRGLMINAGNGDAEFSFIHVSDVVRALITALENNNLNGKAFYICEQKRYKWDDFIQMMADGMHVKKPFMLNLPNFVTYVAGGVYELVSICTGVKPVLNRDKAREAGIKAWTADPSLWECCAGWSNWITLEEGIRKTFGGDKKIA